MQFELTEALMDDILFAMEDQMGEFLLDTVEGEVVCGVDGWDFAEVDLDEDDANGEPRYISLPDWESSNGFRLMEHFAAGLRNPIVREELTSALNLGKGVFRAFKDTLARYPEAEKLWFSFKENEMKKEIVRWYNGLREEWGLEKIGLEPEETHDLILEDFQIRPFLEEDIFPATELHRQCLDEFKNTLIGDGASFSLDALLRDCSSQDRPLCVSPQPAGNTPDLPFKDGLVAETKTGELAGYISVKKTERALYVQRLEVKAEFRGLGIGEALLSRLLESLDPEEIDQVLLDLPVGMESFSRVLHRESFKPYMTRYWLKLRDRE